MPTITSPSYTTAHGRAFTDFACRAAGFSLRGFAIGVAVCVAGCDPCMNDPCDDGVACNGVEVCTVIVDEGDCSDTVLFDCSAGNAVACDQGTCCTEPAGECVDPCADVGCADDVFCNGTETCVAACDTDPRFTCDAGTDPCAPDRFCVEDQDTCVDCRDETDCDDGDRCTTGTCGDGVCDYTPVDCGQGVCNRDDGTCAECIEDTDCDDGNRCTTGTCGANVCTYTPVDCGQGVCNPDDGTCGDCADDEACDDRNPCTTDTCAQGACGYAPVDCGQRVCDPTDGTCADCVEATDCGGGETCVDRTCIPGCIDDAVCDDGDACTTDICSQTGCVNTAIDCGQQMCDTVTGTCVDCIDDTGCTVDERCVNNACARTCTADDGCDDGVFCNGAETCAFDGLNVGTCAAGTAPCTQGETCDDLENICTRN